MERESIMDGDHRLKGLVGANLVRIELVDKDDLNLDEETNVTRTSGMKTSHINALRTHIENHGGFDETISMISVEQQGGDWFVVDGAHRTSAIQGIESITDINVAVWEFENDAARYEFQTRMNVHPPHLQAEKEAVANTIRRLHGEGSVESTEAAITSKVNAIAKGMSKESRMEIINKCVKDLDAVKHWLNLPSGAAGRWLAKNCNPPRVDGFREDHNRNCLGAVVKDGSEYRIASRAIANYNETGKKTQVVVALKSDGGNLKERRQAVVDTINEEFEQQMKFYGVDSVKEYPIEFVGCVPQNIGRGRDAEDPNTLIEINEDEIVQDAKPPKKPARRRRR